MVVSALLLSSIQASAHSEKDYFKDHSYIRKAKWERFVTSRAFPPVVYFYPYGKRPWVKPHGESVPSIAPIAESNPFFGFRYVRMYHCHSPFYCHYHNVFVE